MMRNLSAFVALVSLASLHGASAAETADHGAKIYQRCAACHLPTGAGVPGAFPALAGRVGVAAANDAGRDYLVMTVAAGLMGEIEVDGVKIRGVMPAQAGLTDADIAAVLNYASSLKAPAATAAAKPFTAEEVAAIRGRHAGANPTAVHAIRSGVFDGAASAGDKSSGPEK